MNPVIRFAHVGRRRAMLDPLPAPRVTLRVTREREGEDEDLRDDLDAARGILIAAVLGIALWAAIFAAWFIWS